jgi:DnaJ-class molecular chaperone
MSEIKWRDLSFTGNTSQAQTSQWTEVQDRSNLYELLEVSSAASPEVIKASYRALMEKHHPDKNPEHRRATSEEISRRLNNAYAVLSDPRKRRDYDRANSIHRRA